MSLVLYDTSCWIEHLRQGYPPLVEALEAGTLAMHPYIVSELACGNLSKRSILIGDLKNLRAMLPIVPWTQVIELIESKKLYGRGVGYIDCQLAAACLLDNVKLVTLDKSLQLVSKKLGIAY